MPILYLSADGRPVLAAAQGTSMMRTAMARGRHRANTAAGFEQTRRQGGGTHPTRLAVDENWGAMEVAKEN